MTGEEESQSDEELGHEAAIPKDGQRPTQSYKSPDDQTTISTSSSSDDPTFSSV